MGKINSSAKYCDLISIIHDRKDFLDALITPVHVYGHSDEYSENLTVLEKLNIEMDKLAGRLADTCCQHHIVSTCGMSTLEDILPTVMCSGVFISFKAEGDLLD